MVWVVSALWLVAVVALGWRYLSAPSRGALASYLVVGLAGVVAYLLLLLTDGLPVVYTAAMTTVVVLLALVSTVWQVLRQRPMDRDRGPEK